MSLVTKVGKLAIAALGKTGLTIPRIAVYTNDFEPTDTSVFGDFTLPVFAGYANVTPTIAGPYVSQEDGTVRLALSQAVFPGAAADDGVAVFGWLFFDNVTHDVFAAGRFNPAPKSLVSHLDRITIDEEMTIAVDSEDEVES